MQCKWEQNSGGFQADRCQRDHFALGWWLARFDLEGGVLSFLLCLVLVAGTNLSKDEQARDQDQGQQFGKM